jgi:serine/threonine protein kinase
MLQYAYTLMAQVDPMTSICINEDSSVSVDSMAFPVIPQLVDAFFSFDAGDPGWEASKTVDTSGDIGFVTVSLLSTAFSNTLNQSDRPLLLQVSECFGTDLYSFCVKHPHLFQNDAFCREIIRQLLLLFAEMHAKGLAHRDFKPHNALIEVSSIGFPVIRLCDVGSAKLVRPVAPTVAGGRVFPGAMHAQECSTPYITSRFYRAPELLCGSIKYGTPVDIWALAVAISEILLLSHSLSSVTAAKLISLTRGDGRIESSSTTTTETVPKTLEQDFFPAPQVVIASGSDFPAKIPLSKHEISKRTHCTIFHGATSDGSQLAQIFNLLGTPSEKEIEGMRLEKECETQFRTVVQTVIARSHNRPAPGDAVLATALPGAVSTAHNLELSPPEDPTARSVIDAEGVPSLDLVAFMAKRYIPADIAELLSLMLKWDPRERITAAEALRHESVTKTAFIPITLRNAVERAKRE